MVGSAFLHRYAPYARQALRQSSGEGISKAACTWRWLVRAMLAVEAVTIGASEKQARIMEQTSSNSVEDRLTMGWRCATRLVKIACHR